MYSQHFRAIGQPSRLPRVTLDCLLGVLGAGLFPCATRLLVSSPTGGVMKWFRFMAIPVLFLVLGALSNKATAQVTINIGVAPVCPYGYFNYPPYQCAPFGYYGPQWFGGGIFIGAGPWFHGPEGFHGYVNREFDPHFGYRGPFPVRGEHA